MRSPLLRVFRCGNTDVKFSEICFGQVNKETGLLQAFCPQSLYTGLLRDPERDIQRREREDGWGAGLGGSYLLLKENGRAVPIHPCMGFVSWGISALRMYRNAGLPGPPFRYL